MNYVRFLLSSGLEQEEIRQIAREQTPELEVCFSEEEGMERARTLQPGMRLVAIC